MTTTDLGIDRHSPRVRPARRPIMHQRWHSLLFMHWPLAAAEVRRIVPEPLSVDTFDGQAWIGVVPFSMSGVRLAGLPPLPGTGAFHELNVRTYVHYEGCPGVWFFSLDAASRLAVRAARRFWHLPYRYARMRLERRAARVAYDSVRIERDMPWASLRCEWEVGHPLLPAAPNTLDFFLTERFCLYAVSKKGVHRGRIHHTPWPLREARVLSLHNQMLAPLGLETPGEPPQVRCAERLDVEIFRLERVG